MAYLRDKTRPQGDRSIKFKQDNFGGGLNVDFPATDILKDQVSASENYIWHDRYGTGRSGSVEIAQIDDTIAAELNGRPFYHPEMKTLLYHRGAKIYKWNGVSEIEIVDHSGDPLNVDSASIWRAFGKAALLFTASGIFHIFLENTVGNFHFIAWNSGQPQGIFDEDLSEAAGPYKYKYAYTFCTIIDPTTGDFSLAGEDRLTAGKTLIHESPPVFPISSTGNSYFQSFTFNEPLGPNNAPIYVLPAIDFGNVDPQFNCYGVYRTLDLGQNGLDNQFNEQFTWVGDSRVEMNFTDDITDDELKGRLLTEEFKLRNINWTGLPSGDVGEVTEAFVHAAIRNDKTINYSQRVDDTLTGFFDAGRQTKDLDDGIQVLAGTPDILSIICNRKSYISSLTSFFNGGIDEAVIILNHYDLVDSQVGVRDFGSFAEVTRGTYISVCSDASVRLWDSSGWSRDFAANNVTEAISALDEGTSVGVFYNGAYYLWFDTTGVGYPTTMLRLSVKRESGRGWTVYSGDDMVLPPTKYGVFIADDFLTADGQGIDFLFIVERTTELIYWMETFNGKDGATINGFGIFSYYADKVSVAAPNGFDIECRIKPREMTGSSESFVIIHQESHAYMRDLVDDTENLIPPPIVYPELRVDAEAFVDGKLVSTETSGEVPPGEDMQFYYRVEGSRIAIQTISNRSGHQIAKIDGRFRVQDILRPNQGTSSQVSTSFQNDFQELLQAWIFSRPTLQATLDRVTQKRFSRNGLLFETAPDLRSLAVKVQSAENVAAPFIVQNKDIFDAFTFNVWIKTPEIQGFGVPVLLKVGGPDSATFTINGANELKVVEGSGTVALDDPSTATGNVNGFSQIIIVRESSSDTMNVYQNDELKGTLTLAGTFGGEDIEFGGYII